MAILPTNTMMSGLDRTTTTGNSGFNGGLSFKTFDASAINNYQRQVVTAPLWSGGQASLRNIYTSSAQSVNEKRYYYDVYNSQSNVQGAAVQFSVAYGDLNGSGSSTGSTGTNVYDYPTKAIYSQYRQLLLEPNVPLFTFENGETSEYVYVINVNRSRYKDRIDTNTWQLSLAELNTTGAVSSSNKIVTLIDDATASTTELATQGGRVFNIRSGSLLNGIYTADTTPWGLFYPDNGIIVLNGKALDTSASFATHRSPATASGDDSAKKLFTAISGAMTISSTTGSFTAKTSEMYASTYYFARLNNDEFNYTSNPSFYSGSTNIVKWAGMYDNPRTYVTSIGLYNDNFELLAVAKLNQPIAKTFDKEVSIKIKLDF